MGLSRRAARAMLLLAATCMAIPVAAQDMPPLSAYGALPGVEDVAISPSGNTIAIAANISGSRRILILGRDLSLLRQADTGDFKFRYMEMIGDDAVLFVHSATVDATGFTARQYELQQALVVPVTPMEPAGAVFGENPRLNNAIFGSYGIRRVGDQWRGYFGALENRRGTNGGWYFDHGRPALYEVELDSLEESRAATAPREDHSRDWQVGATGQVVATFDIDRRNGEWYIQNEDERILVQGHNANGDAGIVGLGSAGDTLIYANENAETGLTEWFEVPLAGGHSTPFLQDVEIRRLYWDRDTGYLAGYVEDNDRREPVFFDPRVQERALAVRRAFANRSARMVDRTSSLDRAIMHSDGPGDSGTWWLVDLDTRRALEVGYDRPGILPEQVGPMSLVSYTAADGLELDGVLTLPPGREAANLPVIILPHGGPQSHDEVGFDWWAQAFASRGYAVFQPNFRGSTGHGEEFVRMGFGEWGRRMQSDMSDGLAHLAAEGIVDPQRACIVGASYGGYAALAGVTVQQGLYRCAVSVAGVSDITLMYETDRRESAGSRILRVSLEEELGPRSGWAEVSPRRLAARADAPILLIHGRDDTVVPFQQTSVMADALSDAHKPFELVELEGEDHWLSRAETRMRMLDETMRFVMQQNPPD